MKSLSFAQIKSIVNGDGNPTIDINIDGVSVNPAKIGKNSVFFSLDDNADNISLAIKNGAVAVVSSKPIPNVQNNIAVTSVKGALIKLAAYNRRQVDAFVVGVTGSVGKSSTAEMIQTILSIKGKSTKITCTNDSDIDIAMSMLRLSRDVRYAAIKVPSLPESLSLVWKPSVFVITNVSAYGYPKESLSKMLSITQGVNNDIPIVVNVDDPLLCALETSHPIISFGINNNAADVMAYNIIKNGLTSSFDINYYGKTLKMTIPSIGKHNIMNALAAFCVGIVADISPEQIANAMKWHKNEIFRKKSSLVNGVKIVNDCQNATPDSMAAALDVITSVDCKGKRVCVFGDMSCKCAMCDEAHIELGKAVGRSNVDMLLCFGEKGRLIKKGAIIVSMKNVSHFSTASSLSDYLKVNILPNDVVLFKSSAEVGLEEVLNLFINKAT